jgi:sulfonate transport system ATP-binding protein
VTHDAVVARNVQRHFGGRRVLNGADLHVDAGEFVAIVGSSGSGKTTLLRVLAGLDDEATGTVTVPVRRMLVFQDARLVPWLRVIDNVILGLPASAKHAARDVLAEVGLANHERAWPATLSGGEGQRVALARALLRTPHLLLLDEPFGALDAITRADMRHLLARLHARHRPATLLVTHDLDEAIELADRVLVLRDGRLGDEFDTRGHDTAALRRELRSLLTQPSTI